MFQKYSDKPRENIRINVKTAKVIPQKTVQVSVLLWSCVCVSLVVLFDGFIGLFFDSKNCFA